MSTNSDDLLDLNRLLLALLEKLGVFQIDMEELSDLYKMDYSSKGIAMEIDNNNVVSIYLADEPEVWGEDEV